MADSSNKDNGWTVNIPLSDLIKLVEYQEREAAGRDELSRIRLELSGLRNLYSEVLGVISDLRREIKSR